MEKKDVDTEGWRFDDEGPPHVVFEVRFKLADDELKWLQACADARGVELVDELQRRAFYTDDDTAGLDGFWGNTYARAATLMNVALTPYAAPWPAPRPFRVNEEVLLGQDGRMPSDQEEWIVAADRWRKHLKNEGVEHFNTALECAFAYDGKGAAKSVELASRFIVEEP